MRITNTMINNNLLFSVQNNLERMSNNMKHLNSGKMVNKPSDNPIATAKILRYNTDLSEVEQYKKNVRDATSNLEITETSIAEVGDLVQRARELAVQAANGTNSPEDLQKIGHELEQLTEHLVTAGNFNFAGRYIFSGYNTDQPLLNADGSLNPTLNVENKTANQVDNLKILVGTREEIAYSAHGIQVFGEAQDFDIVKFDATSGQPLKDAGGNLIKETKKFPALIGQMRQFANALRAGEKDSPNKFLELVDNSIDNLLVVRADVGARINRLELVNQRLSDNNMSFTELLSKAQDTDMAAEIMTFKNSENIYRAALSTGAKVIQPTLLDFLR